MTLTRQQRIGIFVAVAVILAIALVLAPPIPQPKEYHSFADQRMQFGVAHALNVLSNLPFFFVGAWGMWLVAARSGTFIEPVERLPYLIFFLGVALTCFGSGWYHLAPDNDRLVWDRLPMTIGFTALFAAILGERVSLRAALRVLPVFILVGIATVFYWIWTEHAGRGDLRPYLFVQFFPVLTIPLLIGMFPPRYTRGADVLVAIGFYVAAKALEHFDPQIFAATGNRVSGHSLKHLAAAVTVWFILRMLQKRQPA